MAYLLVRMLLARILLDIRSEMLGVLHHVASTSVVVFIEECSLRRPPVHFAQFSINVTCQMLQEDVCPNTLSAVIPHHMFTEKQC